MSSNKTIRLQDIPFIIKDTPDDARDLYFRCQGDHPACDTEGQFLVDPKTKLDFLTYFGALSIAKWRRYTVAGAFRLVVEAEGSLTIELTGAYQAGAKVIRETLRSVRYEASGGELITLNYPEEGPWQVVGFSIIACSTLRIHDMYYGAEAEQDMEIRQPFIAMVTTTFHKEAFVRRNERLLREELLSDDRYRDGFCWHIIDNGRTLPEEDDGRIRIHHNRNVGGAGGFARGMLEAIRQDRRPTHVLLMDDDIRLSVESLKRLYDLLCYLRAEYREHFISGAMLKLEFPNIQHENTAKFKKTGRCIASGHMFDLRDLYGLVANENLDTEAEGKHAAWWFCCIPSTVVREDNLPLPLFFRGDDIEYSVRNHARLITMNGICVWHQSFESKFDQATEYYQSRRNELIIGASRPELCGVDTIGFIEEVFWQELYKFNYVTAEMMCDAIEDFLKGPEWYASADLGAVLGREKAKDLQWQPIDETINYRIPVQKLYTYKKLRQPWKTIYDYTYNGQARIPEFLIRDREGFIPAGGLYFQKKQYLTKRNYLIDLGADRYAILEKDRAAFRRLKKRFRNLRTRYDQERAALTLRYQAAAREYATDVFWDRYLAGDQTGS